METKTNDIRIRKIVAEMSAITEFAQGSIIKRLYSKELESSKEARDALNTSISDARTCATADPEKTATTYPLAILRRQQESL